MKYLNERFKRNLTILIFAAVIMSIVSFFCFIFLMFLIFEPEGLDVWVQIIMYMMFITPMIFYYLIIRRLSCMDLAKRVAAAVEGTSQAMYTCEQLAVLTGKNAKRFPQKLMRAASQGNFKNLIFDNKNRFLIVLDRQQSETPHIANPVCPICGGAYDRVSRKGTVQCRYCDAVFSANG